MKPYFNTYFLIFLINTLFILDCSSTSGSYEAPAGLEGSPQSSSLCSSDSKCKLLSSCEPLLEPLRGSRGAWKDIMEKHCGIKDIRQKVCCPKENFSESYFPNYCGQNPQNLNNIVNGENATLGEFPWAVAFAYKKRHNHFNHSSIRCSGSVINARYVLTAAHCVHPKDITTYELVELRLGDWDLTQKRDSSLAPPYVSARPEKIIIHPNYKYHGHVHDIALIRIKETIQFQLTKGYILPICLPPPGLNPRLIKPHYNGSGIVIGWGRTKDASNHPILQKAIVPFANRETCSRYFGDKFTKDQLCVGGSTSDSCDGDSGGALMMSTIDGLPYLQIGVVSFGAECAKEGVPAVYASVSAYKTWIRKQLKPWEV